MRVSLPDILRDIPDHRRREGKRFDFSTVLPYRILAMVAGANAYRQMHEFIRAHRLRLNDAFGLKLPYRPLHWAAADSRGVRGGRFTHSQKPGHRRAAALLRL
jgi:hypothetical protein